MSVAQKYDLGMTLLKVMSDPAEALSDLHTLALDLKAKVDAIDSVPVTADGEKINPLAAKYAEDTAGIEAAETFLKTEDGPFAAIVEYIGEDPGRTYHVLNAVKDLLVKYLTTERDYYAMQIAPKRANVSRKGEYKSDFNEVRELMRNVAGMAQAAGFDPGTLAFMEEDSAGKYRSTLAGFRGTKAADDGSVTGRYARVYALRWVIDGETVEEGWTIPDIVRILWHGTDRIGKNAKSLTDILDEQTKWTDPKFDVETLTINGHNVTVARTTED